MHLQRRQQEAEARQQEAEARLADPEAAAQVWRKVATILYCFYVESDESAGSGWQAVNRDTSNRGCQQMDCLV